MKINKNFYKILPNYFLSTIISLIILSHSMLLQAAEYVYVSDHLRVGMRTEPVSSVPPVSVVFTGMRLEVLEKSDGFIKVNTEKGESGWIKNIYVTKKAPAVLQLNTVREKYIKLKKELSQGSSTVTILEKANMALNEQMDELKAERRKWSGERAKFLASQYKETSWFWLIELLVVVVLSFVAGVYWYRTRTMKRLGGLRI